MDGCPFLVYSGRIPLTERVIMLKQENDTNLALPAATMIGLLIWIGLVVIAMLK